MIGNILARRRYRRKAYDRFVRFMNSGGMLDLKCTGAPKISIILVTYNQPELILKCLTSLKLYRDETVEVVIVDNGSNQPTKELLERLECAEIILNAKNLGFIEGANSGASESNAPYILHLNSDICFLKPILAVSVETLTNEESVGVVGARIIRPDNRLQEAGSQILLNGKTRALDTGQRFVETSGDTYDVDFVSGAYLMTHRELWLELGGFSTIYSPAYYEDVDYCVRARNLGKRTVVNPKISVMHLEHGSGSKKFALKQMKRNRSKFVNMHIKSNSLR